MANQESTAIHDLIRLVQGGQVARISENPVPELFVPAVRVEQTLDQEIAAVPWIGRHRYPQGTPAPVLPTPIAQGTPAQAYRVPTHVVEHDDEQTELWEGSGRPDQAVSIPALPPAVIAPALPVARPYTAPHVAPRAATATSHLPKELSPAVRYAGLGALALAAISIGTYFGASGSGPSEPSERDRAIAIMSGEMPAPVATTHVTAPTIPTVRIEAVAAPVAAEKPVQAKPAEPVIWSPPVVIDSTEIDSTEIEMEAERKPAARRIARTARISTPSPVIAEKPIAKPKKEKIEKKLVATEIAAPKGAAEAKGSGSITISSNRPAMIYLDGRPTGKTTPSALVVAAGDHQITLLDPGSKKAKTATVKIAANKSVTISREF
jgi:hypothetical protein